MAYSINNRCKNSDRLLANGCYTEAIAPLTRSIALDSGNSNAYVLLGVAYNALDRNEDAIAALTRATELDPNNSDAWFYLGIAHNALGQYADVIMALTQAIALDPQSSEAYFLRGMSRDALGDVDGALQDTRDAVRLNNDAVLFDWLNRQRPGEAARADALLARGWRLCRAGRPSEGLRDLFAALNLYPSNNPNRRRAEDAISRCGRRRR